MNNLITMNDDKEFSCRGGVNFKYNNQHDEECEWRRRQQMTTIDHGKNYRRRDGRGTSCYSGMVLIDPHPHPCPRIVVVLILILSSLSSSSSSSLSCWLLCNSPSKLSPPIIGVVVDRHRHCPHPCPCPYLSLSLSLSLYCPCTHPHPHPVIVIVIILIIFIVWLVVVYLLPVRAVLCCFCTAIFAQFCTGGWIGQCSCMCLVRRYAATSRNWPIVWAKGLKYWSTPRLIPTLRFQKWWSLMHAQLVVCGRVFCWPPPQSSFLGQF